MPAITHKQDIVAEGLARLPQQYKGKANLQAMLTVLLQGVQDLEDAIDGVHQVQSIDGALAVGGVPLDALGDLIGQPREGRSDESYARHIRARIAINKSQGRVEDIYRIARAILPDRDLHQLELNPDPPKVFQLIVTGALADIDEAADLASFVQAGAKAGTRAYLLFSLSAPEDTFTFDAGPGLDVGALAGEF